MRSIRIENNNLFVGGRAVDLSKIDNKSDFLTSLLILDVEVADDMNAADIMHFFYDAKDVIKNILSEDYEVVRALVMSGNLASKYTSIRLFKSFRKEVEDDGEFMYIIPEIELIPAGPGEDGISNISGLPIQLDENIKLDSPEIEAKSKFTLMDVMVCLFDELPALLQGGALLS